MKIFEELKKENTYEMDKRINNIGKKMIFLKNL